MVVIGIAAGVMVAAGHGDHKLAEESEFEVETVNVYEIVWAFSLFQVADSNL